MNNDIKIGITERGDAGLDFTWIDKIDTVNGVICISKAANEKLLENLLKYKDKIIYHATCTSLGSTIVEPNVPTVKEKLTHIKTLIEKGFFISHIVMRIDPLVPIDLGNKVLNNKYLFYLEAILKFCTYYNISVRYSYLDFYNHVIERFNKNNLYFSKFPIEDIKIFQSIFSKYPLKYMSCGEIYVPDAHKIGCVSIEDFKRLNLDINKCTNSNIRQRKTCLCCTAKTELLEYKNQCQHKCLYCYWKN